MTLTSSPLPTTFSGTYKVKFTIENEEGTTGEYTFKIIVDNDIEVVEPEELPSFIPARLNITEITSGGFVTIKSNTTLRIPTDYNITTEEEFDCRYVINQEDVEIELEECKLINFTERAITVQLTFDNPLLVSQGDNGKDEIIIRL